MKKIIKHVLIVLILGSFFLSPIKAHEFPVDIKSHYAILLNLDDERTLFEKNSDKKMYPASMTKVMTVWVALQHIEDLDQTLVLTSEMFEGLWEANASVAGFKIGEEVSLRDLLYAILLPSGADACRAIAFYVAGSEEAFVELMNQQALAMGLTHTHFVNTSGLHDEQHYTTAQEMAEIVKQAIQNPTFLEMYQTQRYTTSPTKQHPNGLTFLANAHRYALEAKIDDSLIQGSKTGYTDEGGMCLSSITEINDMHFLMIVGQAGTNRVIPQHLLDTLSTYEYLSENYEKRTLKHEVIDEIDVKYYGTLPIQLDGTHQIIVPKDQRIEYVFKGQESYISPIEKDTVLGEVEVVCEDEVIKQIPVHAHEPIERKWTLFIVDKMREHLFIIGAGALGLLFWIKKRKAVSK